MEVSKSTYPIYLDYNATTPLDPEVIKEIHKALEEGWGNPSSSHSLGTTAKNLIESSRKSVAQMINAKAEDIVFMSGGTEANNVALQSVIQTFLNSSQQKPHVIASNVEHDSVIKYLEKMQSQGIIELSLAKVDNKGRLEAQSVINLIQENTCLITVMHANNETGLLMPIKEIGNCLRKLNNERKKLGVSGNYGRILFHTDAAQSLGKLGVDVQELGVDYLTIVGHKFYGPRIGALFARDLTIGNNTTPLIPLTHGGGQERGYRPGTENTPMIAGLGKAASLVTENFDIYNKNMENIRAYFIKELEDKVPGIVVNFNSTNVNNRLPNTISLQVPKNHVAKEVLNKCNGKIFASVGAACHSHSSTPSGSLIASGLSPEEASRTIRFSVGRTTSVHEIKLAIVAIAEACGI